jgi:hypothetical protein
MVDYYVKLDGVRKEMNASLIVEDSFEVDVIPAVYQAKNDQTIPIASDSTWYQINLGNVYTAKYFSLESDYPVNVNLNNAGAPFYNTYNMEFKGDVSYVYLQNSGLYPASVKVKAYGTNGVRSANPMSPILTVQTITVSTTLTLLNSVIFADCTGGPIVVSLPYMDVSDNGKAFVVKKVDLGVNSVTVTAYSGQLIDGGSSKAWSTPNAAYSIVWNGTSWGVI